MESKKILLVGGGGHCASVLDCLLEMNCYAQIGIIDPKGPDAEGILGIPVVGADEDLQRLRREGWNHAFVTLGSVGNTALRRKIFRNLQSLGFEIPNIIDPTAIVARDVCLDRGIFVGKRVIINARSRIGEGAILNSAAVIEHDCEIGAFVHISPGTTLCGGVRVGDDSHIGAGSVVRQLIPIGSRVLVGTGSNVVKPLPDGVVAYGNPCKVVNHR